VAEAAADNFWDKVLDDTWSVEAFCWDLNTLLLLHMFWRVNPPFTSVKVQFVSEMFWLQNWESLRFWDAEKSCLMVCLTALLISLLDSVFPISFFLSFQQRKKYVH
jgi:hypothetical protein